jgi:hypothetical protein
MNMSDAYMFTHVNMVKARITYSVQCVSYLHSSIFWHLIHVMIDMHGGDILVNKSVVYASS